MEFETWRGLAGNCEEYMIELDGEQIIGNKNRIADEARRLVAEKRIVQVYGRGGAAASGTWHFVWPSHRRNLRDRAAAVDEHRHTSNRWPGRYTGVGYDRHPDDLHARTIAVDGAYPTAVAAVEAGMAAGVHPDWMEISESGTPVMAAVGSLLT